MTGDYMLHEFAANASQWNRTVVFGLVFGFVQLFVIKVISLTAAHNCNVLNLDMYVYTLSSEERKDIRVNG